MPGCPVSPTAVATMAMGFANRVSDGHIAPAEGDQKNRKVLVVFTHPRGSKSYAHSMLESTVNGLTAAGHSTRVRRLYYESAHHQESYNGRDFPAVLTDAERTDYLADETLVARTTPEGLVKIGAASEVQQAVADLKWCDSVVFVHPTWWFGFPAILKGYMDRVLLPGVAFTLPDGSKGQRVDGGLVPLLENVSKIGVVTSYGSSFWTAALLDGGRPFMSRVLRGLCARGTTVQYSALYEMDTKDRDSLVKHLAVVEDSFRKF